jgi:HSA
LAAQNIRAQNEVPRQPAKVHWDYVLEEAKVVRDAMKERRRAFMKVARKAAEKAQEGWVNGKQRKCGSSSAWARLFPTFAISIDPEEARKAEETKETKVKRERQRKLQRESSKGSERCRAASHLGHGANIKRFRTVRDASQRSTWQSVGSRRRQESPCPNTTITELARAHCPRWVLEREMMLEDCHSLLGL